MTLLCQTSESRSHYRQGHASTRCSSCQSPATALGAAVHDSQRPRGVIYRFGVTTTTREAPQRLQRSAFCFKCQWRVCELLLEEPTSQTQPSLQNMSHAESHTPAATCSMVHAVNRQSRNRILHAIRAGCSLPEVDAQVVPVDECHISLASSLQRVN